MSTGLQLAPTNTPEMARTINPTKSGATNAPRSRCSHKEKNEEGDLQHHGVSSCFGIRVLKKEGKLKNLHSSSYLWPTLLSYVEEVGEVVEKLKLTVRRICRKRELPEE